MIEVPDLVAACAALGLPQPTEGATRIEVELLPGCFAAIMQMEGPATPLVYVSTTDLTAARRHVETAFGTAQWGPDTVDPDTLRVRGCLLRGAGIVVDAVHCSQAEETGAVPCRPECSPSFGFE